MYTKDNTMKMPTGFISLSNQEMEQVEGGATLTIKVKASIINTGGKAWLAVASTAVCATLLASGVGSPIALAIIPSVISVLSGAIKGPVKKDQIIRLNIKALKQDKSITIPPKG